MRTRIDWEYIFTQKSVVEKYFVDLTFNQLSNKSCWGASFYKTNLLKHVYNKQCSFEKFDDPVPFESQLKSSQNKKFL